MVIPEMYKRFALLLEAYCWGSSAHLDLMLNQIEVLNWLIETTNYVKRHHKGDKEAATKVTLCYLFTEFFEQFPVLLLYFETFCNKLRKRWNLSIGVEF